MLFSMANMARSNVRYGLPDRPLNLINGCLSDGNPCDGGNSLEPMSSWVDSSEKLG